MDKGARLGRDVRVRLLEVMRVMCADCILWILVLLYHICDHLRPLPRIQWHLNVQSIYSRGTSNGTCGIQQEVRSQSKLNMVLEFIEYSRSQY